MKACTKHVVALAGAALFGFAASAYSEQAPATGGGSGPGMAAGMMGGHGPEMMGRGMMGGHGSETMGRGMMGGRGPAAMGGGMRGGHGSAAASARGMGLGTMLEGLELTDEQRAQLQPLDDELFRKQWDITGKTMEAHRKLHRRSSAEQRDDKAIAEAHKIVRELREQRLLAETQTWEKVKGILTQAQRGQLREQEHECMDGQS